MSSVDWIMKKLEGHGITTVEKAFPALRSARYSLTSFDTNVFTSVGKGTDTNWELVRRPACDGGDFERIILVHHYLDGNRFAVSEEAACTEYPVPYREADLRELVEWCVAVKRLTGGVHEDA